MPPCTSRGAQSTTGTASTWERPPGKTWSRSAPTPADAAKYGDGPSGTTKQYVYVENLAANASLVAIARRYASQLGTTSRADATGSTGASAKGTIPANLDVGVIGSANLWTEPLALQESQNALYESDAGENEGVGFAYTNAQLGVPWLAMLSSRANAARAHYVVATKVYETATGAVKRVQHTTTSGKSVTVKWPFASEYHLSAGTA